MTDESIDSYDLGARLYPLTNARTGEKFSTTAYTVPIHDPDSWEIVNTQYRLENPPAGFGKYRQESGLPPRSFYARPHTGGDCIFVEGAIKAMVLDQLIGKSMQVIGLPGITPSEKLIDELSGYKRKFFLPDPDVSDANLQRFRERLSNLRIVRLPVKPDDAILHYGMGARELREWLRLSK